MSTQLPYDIARRHETAIPTSLVIQQAPTSAQAEPGATAPPDQTLQIFGAYRWCHSVGRAGVLVEVVGRPKRKFVEGDVANRQLAALVRVHETGELLVLIVEHTDDVCRVYARALNPHESRRFNPVS